MKKPGSAIQAVPGFFMDDRLSCVNLLRIKLLQRQQGGVPRQHCRCHLQDRRHLVHLVFHQPCA